MTGLLNAFTTGNPFWGQKLLEISIGRDLGALKGLTRNRRKQAIIFVSKRNLGRGFVRRVNLRFIYFSNSVPWSGCRAPQAIEPQKKEGTPSTVVSIVPACDGEGLQCAGGECQYETREKTFSVKGWRKKSLEMSGHGLAYLYTPERFSCLFSSYSRIRFCFGILQHMMSTGHH